MSALLNDVRAAVRDGWRLLWRSPGFAAVTLLSFAIGIGATTAIFSAVNEVMLRPLPFADPGRLVMLWESNVQRGWNRVHAAPANLYDWRERVSAFQDVAHVSEFTSDLAITTGAESGPASQIVVTQVSGNAFAVLGVQPLIGRTFVEEETWASQPPRIVLTHAAWLRHFGGDAQAVGRTAILDGVGHEVIGVMRPEFRYMVNDAEAFVTFRWSESRRNSIWWRQAHVVRPIARLKPGVSHDEAAAELATVAAQLEQSYPQTNASMRAGLTPLHEFLVGDRSRPLMLLLGAALFLQLIVCANIANLLTARSFARRQEMSVRMALGADRWRIARLVLAEGLVLAALGSVLGIVVGAYALEGIALLRPADLPDMVMQLDWRLALFTALLAGTSALLFGLQPALHSATLDIRGQLADASRSGTGGRRSFLAAHALVAGEVALAVMLVAGAGLMVRSLVELRRVDAGVSLDGVVTFEMRAPSGAYPTDGARKDHAIRVLQALYAVDGVEAAGAGRTIPFAGYGWTSDFAMEGWQAGAAGTDVSHREVTPGYFRALRVPLLAGELFPDVLPPGAPVPVVVNEAFVRRYLQGETVVGRRIAFDREPTATSYWYTIVGVVGNERMDAAREPRPEIIAHLAGDTPGVMRFVVRSGLPGDALRERISAAAASVDAGVPVTNVRSMHTVAADSLAADRYLMVLLAIFAGIAVMLAAVGVYGVSAQAARSRVREVGIRVALGASAWDVTRTLILRSVVFVGVGVAAGMAGALAAGGLLSGLLFGVRPTDGATLTVVTAAVFVVAVAAALYPAWRTSRVDPAAVLGTNQ